MFLPMWGRLMDQTGESVYTPANSRRLDNGCMVTGGYLCAVTVNWTRQEVHSELGCQGMSDGDCRSSGEIPLAVERSLDIVVGLHGHAVRAVALDNRRGSHMHIQGLRCFFVHWIRQEMDRPEGSTPKFTWDRRTATRERRCDVGRHASAATELRVVGRGS